MYLEQAFEESECLANELLAVTDLPFVTNSTRLETSHITCDLAIEHWFAARNLLQNKLVASALVVHRAQFESVTRSIWLAYAASDSEVTKFSAKLSLESEQAAKHAPTVNEMMQAIAKNAPHPAYDSLARFKDNSWKALNSYAHAGIHPIGRHRDGYPVELVHGILCNLNGLGVVSCMQAVVLVGEQPLQKAVLEIAGKHSTCMPPPL